MNRLIWCGVAAVLSTTGGAALAADDTGAIYVSPMLQYYDVDKDRIAKDNFGAQAGIGYDLPHGLAVEADFSRTTLDITGSPLTQRLSAYSLDVIKKFFPESVIQPYVLAGGGELDDTLTHYPRTYHTFLAEAGLGVLYGLGDQTGSTRVQFRTEAKYRVDWANRDFAGPKDPSDLIFGVGLQMEFGAPVPPPPPPPEPKVVTVIQPAPPPPPPPPPPPAPPAPPRRVSFSADALFGFGKATIRPQSGALDKFAAELQGAHFDVVHVYGYTDRIGSDDYNLKLSQQRAESVENYLVNKGVPASKIDAQGRGKANPVTSPGECDGNRSPKVIACLQPDRRVEIEVSGEQRQSTP